MIGAYMHVHRRSMALFIVFSGIFALIFYLYALPIAAVGYAVLLCAAIALVVTAYDFLRFQRRHNTLLEMRDRISLDLKRLPLPSGLLESDYQELMRIMHRDMMRLVSRADRKSGEMIDYYTLWAHQIKTPIFAMRLLLESEEAENREELSTELLKIEQYVDMVLSYLRLESSSSDLVLTKLELDDIVRPAVRKYARLFILKKLSLDYYELERSVLTDEKWLRFVIEQILSNALKYTHTGGITIRMDGDCLLIADTGIGIAPEDLPRIFEKGFTGYNGRIDKKSTGIGLFLCQRTLDMLSHTISIQSEMGRGTEVRIGLKRPEFMME
ncbi:MAG: sensor histidine kinase [Syntrophomonadaceae bacterium]|nr:sensor histidine kinase [Syntrophomonadaceae bacterium]